MKNYQTPWRWVGYLVIVFVAFWLGHTYGDLYGSKWKQMGLPTVKIETSQ
jgi:hypothetical protein|tara:strand:- start:540 stop:689 length:150 start_codon:yes stop_codon:yes gene_type:complete